jgi:hypothetical protein
MVSLVQPKGYPPLQAMPCNQTKPTAADSINPVHLQYSVRAGQLLKQPLESGVCMYCTVPGFLQSAGPRELVRKYCVYHATRSSDRSRLVENGSRMGQGLVAVVGHSHINRGFW